MKCPGQDTQYWTKDSIFETKCSECGHAIEFFKDDTTRRCSNCKKIIVNPKTDFGCASYCQYAEQCVGTLPEEFVLEKENLLKDRVAIEVKNYFEKDYKSIGLAVQRAEFAEKIVRKAKDDDKENTINFAIILCSAYLYDIGIKPTQEKHHSLESVYKDKDGYLIVRKILEKLGTKKELIDEVCNIISCYQNYKENKTLNFQCFYDAQKITYMLECKGKNQLEPYKLKVKLDKIFLTSSGKKLAKKVLLGQ